MRVQLGRGGFTLIELMVVIAVISMLAAVAVPRLDHIPRMTYLPICVVHMAALEERWLVENPQSPGPVPREAAQILCPHGQRMRSACLAGDWSYVVDPDGHVRCTVHGTREKNRRTMDEWMDHPPVMAAFVAIGLCFAALGLVVLFAIGCRLGQLLVARIQRALSQTKPGRLLGPAPAHEGVSCPLCNGLVRWDVGVCADCGTLHHGSCLEQAGGCAVQGCSTRRVPVRRANRGVRRAFQSSMN